MSLWAWCALVLCRHTQCADARNPTFVHGFSCVHILVYVHCCCHVQAQPLEVVEDVQQPQLVGVGGMRVM